MSGCGPFKCGLRRFDGHGVSSYRPTNPEAVRQFNSSYEAMIAERTRQDSGVFQASTIQQNTIQQNTTIHDVNPIQSIYPEKIHTEKEYYSLSDSKKS